MFLWFSNLSHVSQALIASLFTWSVTMLGAAIVFFFKEVKKGIMDALLGFSAGVMIAASFWSLLSPSIELANSLNMTAWIVAVTGFLAGGLLLFIGDKIFNYFSSKNNDTNISKFKRCLMLIFSITLHNIPEGLVVGVAFGSLAYGIEGARGKAFFIGQLSGMVEPISAVIGAMLVLKIQTILPFLLAFAAGAMVYVVVEELIPESQSNTRKDLMALFTLIGFSVMMILDVALG